MLRAWPLHEQRAFFEDELGIPARARGGIRQAVSAIEQGQRRARCPRCSSRDRRASTIRFDTTVTNLSRAAGGFTLETSNGRLHASRVVLATGGLSVPATGSDGIGLRIAQALESRIIDTYPALTPLAGRGRSSCIALRRLAERPVALERRRPRHRNAWRVPVHASRLQRPERARHLARHGARRSAGDSRAVVALRPHAERTDHESDEAPAAMRSLTILVAARSRRASPST